LAKRKRIGAGIGAGLGEDVGKDLAAILDEWEKLPGRKERYRNKRTGKTISRRQYENLKARAVGWSSWSEYQREARHDDWMRFRGIAAHQQKLKPKRLGMTSEFSQKYLVMKRARNGGIHVAPDLYDPDGPLAEFLVYMGLRKPDAEWNVGDTP
jgi:hypothetical protein